MLNANTLPATLINFYRDYDLQRPTVEAINRWSNELNEFLEQHTFPNPELRKEFYENEYAKLQDAVERVNAETVAPLHAALTFKNALYPVLSKLLEDDIDHQLREERLKNTKVFNERLSQMSVTEIGELIQSLIVTKPKGDSKLFESYTATIIPNLQTGFERFKTEVTTERHYRQLAQGLGSLKTATEISTEDLKHLLATRANNPLGYRPMSPEEVAKYGYLSALARLDYIYDLEVEYRTLRGHEGEPKRDDGIHRRVYDKETVQAALELANKDKQAFLDSDHPRQLYSRVNNFILGFNNNYRAYSSTIPSYRGTTEGNNAWLKEHYYPVASAERDRVKAIMDAIIVRRNQASHPKVFDYFNEIANGLSLNYENFANFASKKTMKHTMGLVNALVSSARIIVQLTDDEVLSHRELSQDKVLPTLLNPADWGSEKSMK